MRVDPVAEKAQLPLPRRAALRAQPLVHIQVHRRKVDARNTVVAHKIHALQRGPWPRVGVQEQRAAGAEEALAADGEEVHRVDALDIRRHVGDPALQRVAAVEGDVVSSEQHLEASSAVHADSFQRERVNPTEVANVKILTATDVATGNYSVWDVVLPLPGYDVFLPNHSVKDYFLSLLDSFGLDLDYFKNEAPAPFRLKGAYRRILQRPFDLTWKIIEYDSPDVEIAETEFCSSSAVDAHSSNSDATNVSRKRSIENISTMSNSMDNDVDRKSTHQILGDESNVQVVASRRALSIGFSLSSGSYATMLLRELTKQSMETQYHSGLTASVALEGRADETLDV